MARKDGILTSDLYQWVNIYFIRGIRTEAAEAETCKILNKYPASARYVLLPGAYTNFKIDPFLFCNWILQNFTGTLNIGIF